MHHFKSMKHWALLAAAGLVACGGSSATTGDPTTPSGGAGGQTAAGTDTKATESFRADQPEAGSPRPFQLPAIKTFKLDNGIDVYLVENHDLPTISVSLVMDGGSMMDPAGKEGLASVCMDMLTEGTRKLDKLAFQRALADIGSDVWSWAGLDNQGLGMRTLSSNFDKTLSLFVDSIQKPGFRKSDLSRMTKRRIASIKQAKGSPGAVAGRVLWSLNFGPAHPKGRITTEGSLAKLRTSDCRRHLAKSIKPSGARMFVVGDLTEAQIRKSFVPAMKKWRGSAKVADMPDRKPRPGRIFFVDIPGAAQSAVYLSHPGPERKDPQYFANWMMAQIYGGSFSSRVNMNLREDKGYAYGARGGFSYTRDFGSFYAGASVRSDSTVQSIRELMRELHELHENKKPASEAELSREKNGAILALPARFATSKAALAQYRGLVYHGLPLDYYNSFVSNVSNVNLEQVTKAARAQLKPDGIQLLVVGDAKAKMKVRDDSGKDVPWVDRDGNPITLLHGLQQMADQSEIGKGGLVILDADGRVKKK